MARRSQYVFSSLFVKERPYCRGPVNAPLAEAIALCSPLSTKEGGWVPDWPFERRVDCWVHSADRSMVYLDVTEPISLWIDTLAIGACVAVALFFGICLCSSGDCRPPRASASSRHVPPCKRCDPPCNRRAAAASSDLTHVRV